MARRRGARGVAVRHGRFVPHLIFALLIVVLACGRSDEASERGAEVPPTSPEESRDGSAGRESAKVRSRPLKPVPSEVAEAGSARESEEGSEPDTPVAERAREAADPVFDEELPEEFDAPEEPPVVFDVDALLETGLTRAAAEERWDQWQVLDEWQSDLTQHARELGWVDTPAYREQRAQINRDFAQRYGDDSLREIQQAIGQTFTVIAVHSGQPATRRESGAEIRSSPTTGWRSTR